MKMGMVQRRRRRDLSTLDGLVRAGRLQVVNPTTDTGWRSYGAGGRLFLPAATNYVTNPGSRGTKWGIDVTGFTYTLESSAPVPFPAGLDSCTKIVHSSYSFVGVTGAGVLYQPVAAGDVWTYSYYVHCSAIDGDENLYIKGTTYLDNTIVRDNLNTITVTAVNSSFVRYAASFTIAAGENQLTVQLINRLGTGTFYVTGAVLEKSPFPTPYFDGNTHDCAWTGTPNASTSTRGLSMLIYAGKLNIEQSGTVAVRGFPLWDVATSAYGGSGLVSAKGAGSISWAVGNKNSGNPSWYHLYNDGTTQNGPVWSLPSGAAPVHLVGRLGPTTVDLNFNGTDKTQLVTTNNRSLISYIGYYGLCASTVGPTLISPTRKSDAWVTAIQANSGAAYNDPVRLYREFMSPGDMLIPLQGDSRAYKKV